MKKSPSKLSAIAIAATLALGLYTSDASALALGRVTVQSSLGEPFRAEIDIPEINAEEAASLRAAVASGAAFRTAGMELTPTIASVKITLQRRTDGRYYLRLTSDRAVNEPFLDLVLEATWSSGRVVRDYTMLFDPPDLRQGAPMATAQAASRSTPVTTPVDPRQAPAAAAIAPPARAARAQAPRAEAPQASRGPAPVGDGQRVTVRSGETAGRIAATHKPAAISLDQMLVAMLRANPDAFIAGNVNRLRTGAVLDLPTADQAGATEPAEARQLLVAQSRDFNEFRRRLAEGAPLAAVTPADRQSTGRLKAEVEEKASAGATPDKLTLSQGAVQGKAAADSIARERAAQDASARMAELNKNIEDLNKLSAGGAAAAGAAAKPGVPAAAEPAAAGVGPAVVASAPAAAQPATPAVTPAVTPGVTAPAAPAVPAAATAAATEPAAAAPTAPAPTDSSAPTAAAEGAAMPAAGAEGEAPAPDPAAQAAAAAPPANPPTAAPAPVEASMVDELLQNPVLPAAAGGLLAALLGFGIFRARQRKKASQVDSSYLESRVEPDSFFGASGGQRIDTAQAGGAVGSSMVYSASQLDAAGDVDPVAEADVYLAYGRDLQAEEILKEALRNMPERVAIHGKLLEIYAKRREVRAFNKAAEEAFSLTRGQGPEWDHICTLGRGIDPENALYQPGGQPTGTSGTPDATMAGITAAAPVADAVASSPARADTGTPSMLPPGLELDFDLDLGRPSAYGSLNATAPETANLHHEQAALAAESMAAPTASLPPAHAQGAPAASQQVAPSSAPSPAQAAADHAPTTPNGASGDSGLMEFDLSSLSLDLDRPAAYGAGDTDTAPSPAHSRSDGDAAIAGQFDVDGDDPLATKLALAEEFSAIGDPDGARSLAEEVRNEASGALKGRAERFLAELS